MLPERARAVVIGGGVIGCSCLYHLAKQGWTDSVLVEQFQLTHGSTWHSAGLVGQLRSSISLTRMMQYSVGLYAELKELTGNDPGWHQLGGLRLASSRPRLAEIRRPASWAKTFGLPMESVSAEGAQTPAPWAIDGIPDGFEAKLLPQEWERMEELFTNAITRVPAMENAEVKMFFNGPEAFTPDADFLLGETDVPGFWIAAGGCAHGLAGAGGIGKMMSEWIVDGRPEWDVWPLDWRRFGRQYRSREYTLARTYEALSKYYDIKYPGEERQAGRPLRVSPIYQRHLALDASFGEKGGWERVNWYGSNAAGGDESLRPRGWAGENWSPAIEVEARAAREGIALFDQSSFSKLEVLGPGALAFLERLCANRIDRPVGTIVYTQLLNKRGGIEADLSVTRRAEDRFMLVTGTAFGTHDRAWLERNMPRDGSVYVNDVTGALACLCLWGPKARDVVSFDHGYMQAREVTGGNVPCIASRVTYVGELGWELYCPAEYGATLWDTLCVDGVTPGGYRAIESLRLEKGYRAWGSDLTAETTPLEAGLGFAVKMDKEFIRRNALGEPQQKLVCIVLDDPRAVALGSEPVRSGDEVVGRVTSGGYGYAVGASIAYAYMPPAHAEPGTAVASDIFGDWVEGEARAGALYDPKGERIRG